VYPYKGTKVTLQGYAYPYKGTHTLIGVLRTLIAGLTSASQFERLT
jgi:hypothetical protein